LIFARLPRSKLRGVRSLSIFKSDTTGWRTLDTKTGDRPRNLANLAGHLLHLDLPPFEPPHLEVVIKPDQHGVAPEAGELTQLGRNENTALLIEGAVNRLAVNKSFVIFDGLHGARNGLYLFGQSFPFLYRMDHQAEVGVFRDHKDIAVTVTLGEDVSVLTGDAEASLGVNRIVITT